MADSKFKIKPIHLVFIGLTIIILGVLIPSFFINAFSTIGFAVIIGSLILLSAYAFFAVNLVRSKGRKTIKWLALPVLLGLLVVGGFYANGKYNEYQADKIYAVGDTVSLSTFTFKITDISEEPLSFNTKGINLARINCDSIEYGWDWNDAGMAIVYDASNPHEFSDFQECNKYNDNRKQAEKYAADYNGRMVISYEVVADSTVQGKNLHLELLPDSGRKVNLGAGAGTGDKQYSFMWSLGIKDYVANPVSDFGGDLNKGLTRKGTVGLDLKKTEQIVDVVVKYNGEARTIRINR